MVALVPTDLAAERPAMAAERIGLLVWTGVVGIALVWGTLWVKDAGVSLRAAPLFGHWQWRPGWGLLPAAALGATTALAGPWVARHVRWRLLPALVGCWGAGWAVALSAAHGWDRLTKPLTGRHEYEPFAAGVEDLGPFLSSYVDRLGDYPIHVQGHPPGPVVVAWLLDRVGLAGAGWLAALVVVLWGIALALAVVTQRAVAGEDAARRAAPVLAVLPAAIWAATSLDALFAGVVALAVALMVLAAVRTSPGMAVGGGLTAGVALMLSYGAAAPLLVGVVALAVLAEHRHRHLHRLLALVAGGAAVPLLAAALAGFWWPDGLVATGEAYWAGVASQRPAPYLLLVGNPAALALSIGPAVAAGLAAHLAMVRRRRPGEAGLRLDRAALLPLVALGAVVLVDLSQMSRGEVERIWLPFVPWLALAAPGHRRSWLAAQVGVALVLQSVLYTPW